MKRRHRFTSWVLMAVLGWSLVWFVGACRQGPQLVKVDGSSAKDLVQLAQVDRTPTPTRANMPSEQGAASEADYIWWEAETPLASNFPSQNPFAPANAAEARALSAGAWIGQDRGAIAPDFQPRFLDYEVTVPVAGRYHFYTRKFWKHGAFRWRWDDQSWQSVSRLVYLMDAVLVRSQVVVNWVPLGDVELTQGRHTLRIELTQSGDVAAFDCFVLTRQPLRARGTLKPDEEYARARPGWSVFDPMPDEFLPSPIDWRSLNEAFAGEQGRIQARGEDLVHERSGETVRFWGVNLGLDALGMDEATMARMARFLAKRGVNLVRFHGNLLTRDLQVDAEKRDRLFALVEALKAEGIYTALSIYFPIWIKPMDWLGYSGQHPFGLIFFSDEFQQRYYSWWRELLTTINPKTGRSLRDDPAIALVELVNEDSVFFWTFKPYETIPISQSILLEQRFGAWLTQRYGSIDAALTTWNDPSENLHPTPDRVAVQAAAVISSERRTPRAQDTARFLADLQQQFFETAIAYLHTDLGYPGLVSASNWVTANPRILGPLDKATNTVADVMDRHGYFSGLHRGDAAGYTLAAGQEYRDRTALYLLDKDEQAEDANLPIVGVTYNGKPAMVSELNWAMPNRYRTEFPLLAAAYGLLQGNDAFCLFAMDYDGWAPILEKSAIATPSIMGQFPAGAFLYRQGLLQPGANVADITLSLEEVRSLAGAPISAPQSLDTFRAADIPPGGELLSMTASELDPLAMLVGQVNLRFATTATARIQDLSPYVNRQAKTVQSSTQELLWNYGNGLVTVNAPQAQGAIGFLRQAGSIQLDTLILSSTLDYGSVMLVALDGKPLARSHKMLLQAMSVDENDGWKASGDPIKVIESVGSAPLMVQNLSGQMALNRPDARSLSVTALDANGYPIRQIDQGDRWELLPDAFYYLIEKN
ncbi:hypothetical protein ACQ4M4_01420 [Leptolyngbya sp. AN02str]|uniref:hypothetical protein n=1 Tax=Leptolyngbya sp. AN02str TaxID=3423363 RepID=UPI003D31BA09